MIWFLTFGKNGSAGMPAVPATILMSGPMDSRDRLNLTYGWSSHGKLT